MNIIACTIKQQFNKVEIKNSKGLSLVTDDVELLLNILWTSFPTDDTIKVCWSLDTTITPILKLLGEKRCRKLHKTGKVYLSPYSLFYIPGKVFSIKPVYSKRRANLYELQQYFPDTEAIEQAELIESTGNVLLSAFIKMGLHPRKLTSPVAVWQDCVMNYLNLPNYFDIPKEAGVLAWNCGSKLWTEAYQIGYWEEAWDYDLISSFPSVAKELIDTRHCAWVNSSNYIQEACYSYCYCKVVIYDHVKVSPIIYADEEGNLSTPTGTWKTYLTKGEIDFIKEWSIGEVEIIDGWWAIPNKVVKPLEIVMGRILACREDGDSLIRSLAKRISVGIYGKFGEEHRERFGRNFNPVWFAEISTQVRLGVARFIYENKLEDNLLHVSVDGVLLDKEVKL